MTTFEFIFKTIITYLLEKITCDVNFASKLLQAHDMDTSRAVDALKRVHVHLSKLRNYYNTQRDEAVEMARNEALVVNLRKKKTGR